MPRQIDPSAYDALTFDCYGTLIDWEQGLLQHIRPILSRNDVHVIDAFVLEFFGDAESRIQKGPYQPYRDVLIAVLDAFGDRLGFTPSAAERLAFPESIANWQPFGDTIEALKRLGSRFQLAIVSNVDDDLFDLTAARLGINFDHVITAQQVGAYKPSPKPFLAAIDRIGVDRGRILHVAQSRFHDIGPATALGLTTVWIDRRPAAGGGATPGSDAQADHRFESMAELASVLVPADTD